MQGPTYAGNQHHAQPRILLHVRPRTRCRVAAASFPEHVLPRSGKPRSERWVMSSAAALRSVLTKSKQEGSIEETSECGVWWARLGVGWGGVGGEGRVLEAEEEMQGKKGGGVWGREKRKGQNGWSSRKSVTQYFNAPSSQS